MANNVLHTIEKEFPDFSKGQRLIGNYILNHYDKAAFMTAAKLGETVGVSESTVVRFATEIGYEGYPQLQKALQEMIRNRLTSVQRMEVGDARIGDSDILTKVLQTDMETIRRTLEETDPDMFYKAVDAIIKSRRIYIMGIRSAVAIASFMNFYFTQIFDDVRNIDTASTSAIFEQMLRIEEDDVFIGITFSRYSRRTYQAAVFAKSRGTKVIAITDSYSAPICEVADYILVAKNDMVSFVDSLVAPLSITNALLVAISLEKKDEIRSTYEEFEKIWDEYNVYDTSKPALPEEMDD